MISLTNHDSQIDGLAMSCTSSLVHLAVPEPRVLTETFPDQPTNIDQPFTPTSGVVQSLAIRIAWPCLFKNQQIQVTMEN